MSARFANSDPAHGFHDAAAIWRWGVVDRLTGRRRAAPPGPPAPRVEPDLVAIAAGDGAPRMTWIGHASFLLSLAGAAVAVDPVFSRRVGWLYRRYDGPGLLPDQLPPLAAVLISHNHYDHLDRRSLAAVPARVPAVVPRGLGRWFRRRNRRPVTELAWWQTVSLGGLEITLVPARHWSRRGVADFNQSLWGGFVVRAGEVAVYFAGDSAYFDGFAEIGRRFPGLAAAVLPIGAYSPAWFMERQHMSPEQAGQAYVDLGAERLVPAHWGAFQLTDEPLSEPIERLRAWWRRRRPAGRLCELAVGETAALEPLTARAADGRSTGAG